MVGRDTNQSFRVCKVNLASLKVATIKWCGARIVGAVVLTRLGSKPARSSMEAHYHWLVDLVARCLKSLSVSRLSVVVRALWASWRRFLPSISDAIFKHVPLTNSCHLKLQECFLVHLVFLSPIVILACTSPASQRLSWLYHKAEKVITDLIERQQLTKKNSMLKRTPARALKRQSRHQVRPTSCVPRSRGNTPQHRRLSCSCAVCREHSPSLSSLRHFPSAWTRTASSSPRGISLLLSAHSRTGTEHLRQCATTCLHCFSSSTSVS